MKRKKTRVIAKKAAPKKAVKKAAKKLGDYQLNKTEFAETRIPVAPRKKREKKKKVYAVQRDYDGTFKKFKKVSGTHKDTNSHNVKLTIMSGLGTTSGKMLNEWQTVYGKLVAATLTADTKHKKELQREMKITREIISRLKRIK